MKLAAAGERVVITGEGTARVELRVEADERIASELPPRRLGLLEGQLMVGPEFFDPLPDYELKLWYGEE